MRCRVTARIVALAMAAAIAACGAEPEEPAPPTTRPWSEVRRERLALIRDVAAEAGVVRGALLAGIASAETNLAHCWSEATYACKGPASSSCDGPIIAGSADGPCAVMQGGLGMFQFDDGTWDETLATYGDGILTVEGNTARAMSYVIDHVRIAVPEATSREAAVDWINRVTLVAGEPLTEQWAQVMACEYNGCCAATELCARRARTYRDRAIALYDELGAAFWQVEPGRRR